MLSMFVLMAVFFLVAVAVIMAMRVSIMTVLLIVFAPVLVSDAADHKKPFDSDEDHYRRNEDQCDEPEIY